jgi:23S rRNA (cytidine1920-2'-O)/16S rRNA (cytidine1409-2'-O)-methyltransferase
MEKKRIDKHLVDMGLAESREAAKAMILAGSVIVSDRRIDKPGEQIGIQETIRIRGSKAPYVSRGGQKIEKALDYFGVDPDAKIVLDIGASTGGFTDCLLQRGAAKVFALDVGYGQLAWSLQKDPRVVSIERTNIRKVTPGDFTDLFELITIDVSFISLTLVLPAALELLKPDGMILALIKPQFEVGKGEVGKKGVVRDPIKHSAVVKKIKEFASGVDLHTEGVIESPLLGPEGNKEFFILLRKSITNVSKE